MRRQGAGGMVQVVEPLLSKYPQYHQKRKNKLLHLINAIQSIKLLKAWTPKNKTKVFLVSVNSWHGEEIWYT
jgi:hypothetical protein